jgi:hypothetical protein
LLLAASPVAFFTKDRALSDSPDFEFRYTRAIWRFHHMGNRAAFAAQPEIYMPQFGGYDPMGVIRGIAVAGNPKFGSSPGSGSIGSTFAPGWKGSPLCRLPGGGSRVQIARPLALAQPLIGAARAGSAHATNAGIIRSLLP